MPQITFDRVTKSFGQVEVLREFSVSFDDGEFVVLLGPSGCGKSTLLRMIAGLADVSSGTISFDDEAVNSWDVRRRNVAFVFQSYALYPQMTVRQNIAFPMLMDRLSSWQHLPLVSGITRRRLMKTPEISEKVEAIAAQLELSHLLSRRPAKLSGGQRQRVALARSLVREPSMYLLDEPLSNLDAILRTQMRSDITSLHRTVGKTFVFVTHDQVEAMTMATKIVVMNKGLIQQVGTPDDIYDRPANTFVATFVGSPPMNLFAGDSLGDAASVFMGGTVPSAEFLQDSIIGVRPEHLVLENAAAGGVPVTIEVIERIGAETLVGCRTTGAVSTVAESPLVFVRAHGSEPYKIADQATLRIGPGSISWFSRETGKAIDGPVVAATNKRREQAVQA